MNNKLHWYYFCIFFQASNGVTYKDVSCGFTEQKITNARLSFAKESAGAPSNALVSSISYLGKMTREEFEK